MARDSESEGSTVASESDSWEIEELELKLGDTPHAGASSAVALLDIDGFSDSSAPAEASPLVFPRAPAVPPLEFLPAALFTHRAVLSAEEPSRRREWLGATDSAPGPFEPPQRPSSAQGRHCDDILSRGEQPRRARHVEAISSAQSLVTPLGHREVWLEIGTGVFGQSAQLMQAHCREDPSVGLQMHGWDPTSSTTCNGK